LFLDRGLRYLLESTKIVKVMHDCRRDSEALYFQYGVTLHGVWDSQIAYSVLSQLKGYKTPYPIGLNTLLKACSCEENKFKDMVKSAMSAMKNFWEVRPLSRMMIDYAAGDVSNLLRVYSMLNNELQSTGQTYDFNRIIEDYSIEYLEMNVSDKPEPDKAISNGLYGIRFWDQDIGFGPREDGILEEYDCFSTSHDNSSSGEPSTPPQGSEKKKRRKRRRRVKRADVLNFEDFPPLQPSLQAVSA